MWLGLVLFVTAVFFLAQLWCCFRGKRRWVRLLPLTMACLLDVACWVALLLSKWLVMEDSLGFAGAILGIYFLLTWIPATALAWGIYGLVKLAQKKAK